MAEGIEKEKKQLIIFLKYFALKSAQVIVQSRDGVKIVSRSHTTQSNDKNQHDWFNLAIPHNENVAVVTKDALNGETVSALNQMLCIDIYLKFNEGDEELLLETWTLSLSPDKDQANMCPMGEVYHRMGILLKSLLTLSRIPPAYKLARKQKTEPYTLSYRIYCGDPHLERLGDDIKNIKVGSLVIPIGTITLLVTYRRNLTITPSKTPKSNETKDDNIMLKSDHFKESPKKEPTDKKVPDLNKPLSAGAFVDTNKIEELHKALQENLPPEPPMSWLLYQIKDSPDEYPKGTSTNKKDGSNEASAGETNATSTRSKAIEVPAAKKVDEYTYRKLEFPFADGSPITELANFYHDCLTARSQTEEWCDVAEEMKKLSTDSESLSHQFKVFQDAVPEFDSMVASMFSNSSENNDS